MERIRTTEVGGHIGEQVRVAGWLHSLRRLGGISFLVIRDGYGIVQVVAEQEKALEPLSIGRAGLESVVAIEGTVARAPRAPGGVELTGPRIELISSVDEAPPLVLSKRELKASLATLLDNAVIANRHPSRRATLRLASVAMEAFRVTLLAQGFTEIASPKIVAAATESGSNVFELDYFGRPAYLAQSPQLYKQMMVGVFERVFEVGPAFRAEPHDTTRHLNEFVSLDVEMGFIADHFSIMEVLQDVLAAICAALAVQCSAELDLLQIDLPFVPKPIPHVSFWAAQELIYRLHATDVRGEPDLSPQDERWLGDWAWHEHGSDFLFVTGYPTSKRAFYTAPDPNQPEYSNSFDLLFRGTELVSGGQRLHRLADYLAVLAERALPVEPFADYLEAFRYGMPPHGGFAIGLERLLMQLTGVPNIKLVTLFPRDLNRLTP
ncbi:MAG: aspartate--tRNA(Asn) ligase [Ktedonobacterales bacterium]